MYLANMPWWRQQYKTVIHFWYTIQYISFYHWYCVNLLTCYCNYRMVGREKNSFGDNDMLQKSRNWYHSDLLCQGCCQVAVWGRFVVSNVSHIVLLTCLWIKPYLFFLACFLKLVVEWGSRIFIQCKTLPFLHLSRMEKWKSLALDCAGWRSEFADNEQWLGEGLGLG